MVLIGKQLYNKEVKLKECLPTSDQQYVHINMCITFCVWTQVAVLSSYFINVFAISVQSVNVCIYSKNILNLIHFYLCKLAAAVSRYQKKHKMCICKYFV